MKTLAFCVGAVVSIAAFANEASAQLLSAERCQNAYNVTSAQAQGRYGWALYCRANPGNSAAGTPRPGSHYLTDQSVTDYNISSAALKPYLFPTYFNFTTFAPWDVPDAAGNNCNLLPTSAINVGLCVAGCYVESTPLRFADGDMGIKTAALAGKLDLVTLAPEATIDALTTTTNKVERYTVDRQEDWQTIYSLEMRSGGRLEVTAEHPLLTSDGMMRQAEDLKLGDELVRATGAADPIVAINVSKMFGKVYNVRPATVDYTSNIVVAAGYLNGSVRYQNEFLDMINALILRRSLAENLL